MVWVQWVWGKVVFIDDSHHRPKFLCKLSQVIIWSFLQVMLKNWIDTGGKGPNIQWAHAKYIGNTVNKWLQCAHWVKIGYIQNVLINVNWMSPVGKYWVFLQCT